MPEEFVDAIIDLGRVLTPPTKILASLVVCSTKQQELQVRKLVLLIFMCSWKCVID